MRPRGPGEGRRAVRGYPAGKGRVIHPLGLFSAPAIRGSWYLFPSLHPVMHVGGWEAVAGGTDTRASGQCCSRASLGELVVKQHLTGSLPLIRPDAATPPVSRRPHFTELLLRSQALQYGTHAARAADQNPEQLPGLS